MSVILAEAASKCKQYTQTIENIPAKSSQFMQYTLKADKCFEAACAYRLMTSKSLLLNEHSPTESLQKQLENWVSDIELYPATKAYSLVCQQVEARHDQFIRSKFGCKFICCPWHIARHWEEHKKNQPQRSCSCLLSASLDWCFTTLHLHGTSWFPWIPFKFFSLSSSDLCGKGGCCESSHKCLWQSLWLSALFFWVPEPEPRSFNKLRATALNKAVICEVLEPQVMENSVTSQAYSPRVSL